MLELMLFIICLSLLTPYQRSIEQEQEYVKVMVEITERLKK